MEIVALVVVGAGVVVGYLRLKRMRAALDAPMSSSACVACGSSSLVETAPQCYRCSTCGYEGGEGHKQQREAAFEQRVATMSPAERFQEGSRALEAAHASLVSATGTFQSALSDSRMDFLGSVNANEDKANTLSHAYSEVMQAQESIRKAAAYLDDGVLASLGLTGPDMNFTSAAFGLEHHFDVALVDVMVHGRIKKARGEAEIMVGAVERALAKLRQSSAYRGPS